MAGSSLSALPVEDILVEEQGTSYYYIFHFEQGFEPASHRVWMEENWRLVCCLASSGYLLIIFGGQNFMAQRYHHVTVLVYCWYSFTEYTAPARWFVVMNFVVHSLMYSYFALKAMRVRVPRSVAMVITSLQLLQMVVGCVVNYTAFTFKTKGMSCGVSETNLRLSLLMYSSYFILFARFFYKAYFAQSQRKFCSMEKEFQVNQKILSPEVVQARQSTQESSQGEGSESDSRTEEDNKTGDERD